jgi:hypothetical protein
MGTLMKTPRSAGGAGLCPAGAAVLFRDAAAMKEGAHGGTMGSPMLEKTGQYQSPDYFTLD